MPVRESGDALTPPPDAAAVAAENHAAEVHARSRLRADVRTTSAERPIRSAPLPSDDHGAAAPDHDGTDARSTSAATAHAPRPATSPPAGLAPLPPMPSPTSPTLIVEPPKPPPPRAAVSRATARARDAPRDADDRRARRDDDVGSDPRRDRAAAPPPRRRGAWARRDRARLRDRATRRADIHAAANARLDSSRLRAAADLSGATAAARRRPAARSSSTSRRAALGIGTVAGYCEELIRRNARVPTEIRKLFTTSRDAQDTVRIIVCQGESRRLDNNVVIGDLTLGGLPPRPRGETSIEVTFQLDASGILQVRARDAHTGKRAARVARSRRRDAAGRGRRVARAHAGAAPLTTRRRPRDRRPFSRRRAMTTSAGGAASSSLA